MNELQTILSESVNRLFTDRLSWDAQTRIEDEGWPAALWNEAVEQGLHKVLAAEAAGGMNGAWADAYVVARACGRHAVPLPIVEAMLAEWLARRADIALPAGVPGLLGFPIAREALVGDRLTVQDARVPWGHVADYLIGVSADGELIIASAAGAEIRRENNLGRDPRDHVTATALPLLGRSALPEPSDCVHWLGALLRSAQIAGGGQACLELALKYAGEREQFGRPLSAFQAIQHHLADLAGTMASVDAMAAAAFAAVDRTGLAADGRNARFEIAAAKVRASEAVEKLTRLSHQIHGAIGFTYEYGLHFVTRRLWAWRAEYGTAGEWGEYLGRIAMHEGGDKVWAYITA